MNRPGAHRRSGSGCLPPGWDGKAPETIRIKKPLHRRRAARRLFRVLVGAALAAAVVTFILLRS